MRWIRQKGLTLLYMALVLAFGVWGGFTLRDSQQQATLPTPAAEPVVKAGDLSVLHDTVVITNYTFSLCGHALTQQAAGGPLEGKTKQDILDMYPDAKIEEFSSQRVVIDRELDSYCPKHYVLYIDDDGKLCYSQTDSTDYTQQHITTLSYDVSSLPDEVKNDLDEGLVFDSLEEINAYLEDVES